MPYIFEKEPWFNIILTSDGDEYDIEDFFYSNPNIEVCALNGVFLE